MTDSGVQLSQIQWKFYTEEIHEETINSSHKSIIIHSLNAMNALYVLLSNIALYSLERLFCNAQGFSVL